jgi:hypothetical protein
VVVEEERESNPSKGRKNLRDQGPEHTQRGNHYAIDDAPLLLREFSFVFRDAKLSFENCLLHLVPPLPHPLPPPKTPRPIVPPPTTPEMSDRPLGVGAGGIAKKRARADGDEIRGGG